MIEANTSAGVGTGTSAHEWLSTVQGSIWMMAGGTEDANEPGAPPVPPAGGDEGSPGGDGADPGGSGGEDAGGGEEGVPPKPVDPPAPLQKADWRDRRIAKLTAQLNESRTRLAPPPVADPAPSTPAPVESDPGFRTAVTAEAQRLASAAEFNRQCDEVANQGKQTFGDAEFNQRVVNLTSMVDRTDPGEVSTYQQFIAACIETGEGPRLIHQLGSDLDEAARIMALPPARMGVELTKIALSAPDSTTRAPRPIQTPRSGGGSAQAPHTTIPADDKDRSDRLSTAEWMKRREADENRWDRIRAR